MEFSLGNAGWHNLFENGHNFINFSMMGMLIVFIGLSVITIYILLLPRILDLPARFRAGKGNESAGGEAGSGSAMDPELLLAIAVALHLEQTHTGSFEKITWQRTGEADSPWLTAGRMRSLEIRSHLPDHRSQGA